MLCGVKFIDDAAGGWGERYVVDRSVLGCLGGLDVEVEAFSGAVAEDECAAEEILLRGFDVAGGGAGDAEVGVSAVVYELG